MKRYLFRVFISVSISVENRCFKRLSVQFSCSVVSDSLRPHGLQHARFQLTSKS